MFMSGHGASSSSSSSSSALSETSSPVSAWQDSRSTNGKYNTAQHYTILLMASLSQIYPLPHPLTHPLALHPSLPLIAGKPPVPTSTTTTTDAAAAAAAAAASVYVSSGPGLPSSSTHPPPQPSSSSSVASTASQSTTTIVVEGRKLTTRRHRDFVARQRHDSESTTSEPTETPREEDMREAPFGWVSYTCITHLLPTY